MSVFWEWEKDRVCRDMAEQGASAAMIAPAVGKSRCAVVGYCRRHGIQLKGRLFGRNANQGKGISKASAKRVEKAEEASQPVALPPAVPIAQKPIPARSLLTAGPFECRFPIGPDPANLIICGDQVQYGSSYCSFHHRRCWVPR